MKTSLSKYLAVLAIAITTVPIAAEAAQYNFHQYINGFSVSAPAAPAAPLAFNLASATLPDATKGTTYSYQLADLFSMTGDNQPTMSQLTWQITSGTLPDGLSLDSTSGAISGIPTTKGNSAFQVSAAYNGTEAGNSYTINVNGVIIKVSKMASRLSHTCAVTTTGGVKCWGYNGYGQLGDGTMTNSTIPVDVQGLSSGVVDVGVGSWFSCALMNTGNVQCWGRSNYGQLGRGSTITSTIPVTVSNINGQAKKLTVGGHFSCVQMKDDTAKCWGYNAYGNLGDGSTTNRLAPVVVNNLGGTIKDIETGVLHACAITTSGPTKCWGYGYYGEMGDGSNNYNNTTPRTVSNLGNSIVKLSLASSYSCAIVSGGDVYCWGYNASGQLGNGTMTNANTPVPVTNLGQASYIMASDYTTCAITTAGVPMCWGHNNYGQLGNGLTTDSSTPTTPTLLNVPVTQFAIGSANVCALTSTNDVKCWGGNWNGQLGNGTVDQSFAPTDVAWP